MEIAPIYPCVGAWERGWLDGSNESNERRERRALDEQLTSTAAFIAEVLPGAWELVC